MSRIIKKPKDTGILLVTYELKGPSTQYGDLYEVLKKNKGWAHYLASTWLIATEKGPTKLYEEIKPHLQEGDRLLVVRLAPDYFGRLPDKAWAWIDRHKSEQSDQDAFEEGYLPHSDT